MSLKTDTKLDFVYIDDVVDATIAALESSSADGEIFNVGAECKLMSILLRVR